MKKEQLQQASLLVLSAGELSQAALCALEASANSLGHADSVRFTDVSLLEGEELVLEVHECDPWCVVAVDDGAVAALRAAFAQEAEGFAPDNPVEVRGYLFVAVPAFEECLQDQTAKRVAWGRLKAAAHPKEPY